jgi:hypothetical protein
VSYLHEWTERFREFSNAGFDCDPAMTVSTLVMLAEHVRFLDACARSNCGGLYAQAILARSGAAVNTVSAMLFGFVRRETVASVTEVSQIVAGIERPDTLASGAYSEHARRVCSHIRCAAASLTASQFEQVVWLVQYLAAGLRILPGRETLARLNASGMGGRILEVTVNLWADLLFAGAVLSKMSAFAGFGTSCAMPMLHELLGALNGAQNVLCCLKEIAHLRNLLEEDVRRHCEWQQIESDSPASSEEPDCLLFTNEFIAYAP